MKNGGDRGYNVNRENREFHVNSIIRRGGTRAGRGRVNGVNPVNPVNLVIHVNMKYAASPMPEADALRRLRSCKRCKSCKPCKPCKRHRSCKRDQPCISCKPHKPRKSHKPRKLCNLCTPCIPAPAARPPNGGERPPRTSRAKRSAGPWRRGVGEALPPRPGALGAEPPGGLTKGAVPCILMRDLRAICQRA